MKPTKPPPKDSSFRSFHDNCESGCSGKENNNVRDRRSGERRKNEAVYREMFLLRNWSNVEPEDVL